MTQEVIKLILRLKTINIIILIGLISACYLINEHSYIAGNTIIVFLMLICSYSIYLYEYIESQLNLRKKWY